LTGFISYVRIVSGVRVSLARDKSKKTLNILLPAAEESENA
jgi:hypothetical protein